MKNFWKAIRDSLRYTPAIVLATLCSIGIALIWSSNITALYPVIVMTRQMPTEVLPLICGARMKSTASFRLL